MGAPKSTLVYDPEDPPRPLEELSPKGLTATRNLCKASLGDFVQHAWPILEQDTPLVWNWHLDALCDHVQAILLGKRKVAGQGKLPRTGLPDYWAQNAIFNVPPGSMKTLIVQVFAVAWMWTRKPGWKVICSSGTPSVLIDASIRCREVVSSSWYRTLFKPEWQLSSEQNEKLKWANTKGGMRTAIGTGGKVTGTRADCLLVDDPQDAASVTSKAERAKVIEWWNTAFHNRVNDSVRSTRIVIMQRLHEGDLTGHLVDNEKLVKEGGIWERVAIPMEFEKTGPSAGISWIGWTDPRVEEGELMFPARFPAQTIAEEKVALGTAGYAGQHQQRPAPLAGNRFQRDWWRFWKEDGAPDVQKRPTGSHEGAAVVLPEKFEEVAESWDLSFKGKADSDWVVGVKVARMGSRKFITARIRKQTGFGGAKQAILQLRQAHPPSSKTWVEDKANGPAVIEDLQAFLSGLIAVNPEGGKEARAAVLEPQVEAGEWFLPDGAPWLDEFISEFAIFPNAKHDDQVDAVSQAAVKMGASSKLAYAMSLCQW
jgi:predicted phage terminase large subunit-like protein